MGYAPVEQLQVPIFAARGLDTGFAHHLVSVPTLNTTRADRQTLTNLPSATSSPDNAAQEWYLDIDAIIIGLPGWADIDIWDNCTSACSWLPLA